MLSLVLVSLEEEDIDVHVLLLEIADNILILCCLHLGADKGVDFIFVCVENAFAKSNECPTNTTTKNMYVILFRSIICMVDLVASLLPVSGATESAGLL